MRNACGTNWRLIMGKVESILSQKTGQDAIIEIDDLLSGIYYSNPEQLTQAEKNIVYIEELEREINNGGFSQFFYNSAGNIAHELIAALEKVGSIFILGLVKSAVSEFPDGIVPRDSVKRQKLLKQIEDKSSDKWEKLDQQFYKYEEDIYSMLIEYIKSNIKDFE